MRGKKVLRAIAAAVCICMGTTTVVSALGPAEVKAADDTQWEEIQSIISDYYGEWNDTTYPGQISQYTPDTALLGNGDIGVNSGGNANEKTFYVSKGDFWEYFGTQKALGGYSISQKVEEDETNPNLAPRYSEVTVSSADTWGLTSMNPENAVSGEVNDPTGWGWCSKTQANINKQWFQVQFDEPITVKQYILTSDGGLRPSEAWGNLRDFKLQYSDDGETWENADVVTGNTLGVYSKVLEEAVTAKFFRVYVDDPVQPEFYEAYPNDARAKIVQLEFYQYEKEDSEKEESANLAQNKPVKVSSSLDDGTSTAPLLVDGVYDTKWCSQAGAPQWAIIDLEETRSIGYYRLIHAGVIGETVHNTVDYQLQYLDPEEEVDWDTIETAQHNWKDMDVLTGNTDTTTSKTFEEPINARYIRLLVTNPSTEDTYARVHELELYENTPPQFYEEQDILNAKVLTEMPFGQDVISMETYTADGENFVITELTSKADESMELQAELWVKSDDGNRPAEARVNENGTVSAARSTYNSNPSDEESYTSKAAMSMKILGAETTADATDDAGTLTFTIEPDETVYLITAVGGGGKTYDNGGELQTEDPYVEAENLLAKVDSESDIMNLKKIHSEWWKDYWSASYISFDKSDTELNTMMKYYYGAQYILGSTAREDELAPGIMGIWCNTDSPMWNNHYQLNYNFNAPFYGAGSSNRPELELPLFEQILAYQEKGRANSESVDELLKLSNTGGGNNDYVPKLIEEGRIDPEHGIEGGLLYPVCIIPWGGDIYPGLYHNTTNVAAYSAFPGVDYYWYTMDDEYLQQGLYQYLKECAVFYETWLEKDEDGTYIAYGGVTENLWGYNTAGELSTIYTLFDTLIDFSEILDVDADKRELWIDIRDNLAPQPTGTYNGKEVYTLAEAQWNGSEYVPVANPVPADGNMVPLESMSQSERIGYFSTPEELQIARNTIEVFGSPVWRQANNFPRVFEMAVRARYDIDEIVTNLVNVINLDMQPNLRIKDAYHGIEKSGATEAINNMMMLTHKKITKLFPNWYEDKDAKFVNLRAKGAFLVSAEYDGTAQEAKNVSITSEAGKTMTLVSPWAEGAVVKDSAGEIVKTVEGTVENWPDEKTITFDTKVGETYTVEKKENINLDYTDLDKMIKKAENLSEEDYTPESYQEMQDALQAAKDIRVTAVTQEEIDNAEKVLEEAINNLQPRKDTGGSDVDNSGDNNNNDQGSDNGTVGGSGNDKKDESENQTVQTGDTTPIVLPVLGITASLALLVAVGWRMRKRK